MHIKTAIVIASVSGLLFCQPSRCDQERHSDLVDRIFQTTSLCWWRPTVVEQLIKLELADECWSVMLEPAGFNTIRKLADAIARYAKRQGLVDLISVESNNPGDRSAVDKAVSGLKDKIGVTIKVEGVKCDKAEFKLLQRYIFRLASFLSEENWTPRGGTAFIQLQMSSAASDITVKVDPAAKNFTISVPAHRSVSAWQDKMLSPLRAAAKS